MVRSGSDENILALGMRADETRRRHDPQGIVRYQRVQLLRAGDVRDTLVIHEPATEVRLLDTPDTLPEALALVRAVKEASGPRVVSGFSLATLIERAAAGWGPLPEVLTELAGAGLYDLAEVPVDTIDAPPAAVHSAQEAGLAVRRLTVALPSSETTTVLTAMREVLASAKGIERVAPLPRTVAIDTPTTGYADVRMVAATRLMLDELSLAVPIFIEVDWSIYGPKLAQVALTFGADFLDAVSPTSDEALGRRRGSVEDVERNIRAAGFQPQEYQPVS